jgi:hypothetical protein
MRVRLGCLFVVLGWMFGGFEREQSVMTWQAKEKFTCRHVSRTWKRRASHFKSIDLISVQKARSLRVLGISRYLGKLVQKESALSLSTPSLVSLFIIAFRQKGKKERKAMPGPVEPCRNRKSLHR